VLPGERVVDPGLGAGAHEVKVTFCNDYYDPESGRNRDLNVNRIIIYRREPRYVNSGSGEKQRRR